MQSTFLISNEFFGSDIEELGKKLMGTFLRKLLVAERKPERIIFYNTAVKLGGSAESIVRWWKERY